VRHGDTWERAATVAGIVDWVAALQIEWRWKQIGRTRFKHLDRPALQHLVAPLHNLDPALQRRMLAVHHVLHVLDRPTAKAITYANYPGGPPTVTWSSPALQLAYDSLKACDGFTEGRGIHAAGVCSR
jgi:hypothetical protein